MKNILFFASLITLAPFLLSCNVYSPLNSTSSTQDRLEEAQKCLRDSDYGCAITQYSALADGPLKDQKLCMVYLARGGVTLDTLINTINQNSAQMLGALAQKLTPWTSDKSTDLDSAKTHCVSFAADATAGNQGTLLKSVALFSHCAIRIAKTDLFVATSETDTACTTSGNGNGTIAVGDIGPAAGAITSATPGMCPADVSSCVTDISALSTGSLGTAGLSDLQNALTAIPANLKDTTQGTTVSRIAIRSTI